MPLEAKNYYLLKLNVSVKKSKNEILNILKESTEILKQRIGINFINSKIIGSQAYIYLKSLSPKNLARIQICLGALKNVSAHFQPNITNQRIFQLRRRNKHTRKIASQIYRRHKQKPVDSVYKSEIKRNFRFHG